jgi:flagellar motility protein MotE (MotC chaperone)
MRNDFLPARRTAAGAFERPSAAIALLCSFVSASFCFAGESPTPAPAARDAQQYCANVAASAEAIRLERRRKQLAELEGEVNARLAALESKQNELRGVIDRLEAFERKTSDALTGLYSRMKPEAAAAQLTQLDDEIAAALMLQLKAKVSSAILGEMEASRGAALAKKIAELRNSTNGKKP